MKSKKILSEIEVIKNLKLITEQDDEYYKISPEELEKLFELASYASQVTKLPKFGGKKLYVTGNLNLSRGGKELKSLGNIGYVEGKLDISNTNVSDLSNVIVTNYISDYGTPIERRRIQKELERKRAIANERREEKEWDLSNPNIDEIGLKANALYQWFINNGDVVELEGEDLERFNSIKIQIDELNKKAEGTEDMDEYSSILDEISDLEDELEELTPQFDLYDINPNKYNHYGLKSFEILHPDYRNQEYTVGDDEEMDSAALEYSENYIDEVGIDGFTPSYVEDYIDESALKSYFEDHYEYDVRDNPDVYFSEEDFQLTDEQEKRIEQLEKYIEEMEQLKSDTEDERDEFEHNTDEYNDLDEKIQDIESNIEKAQDELDGIEPDDEPTEEMIEEKVKDIVDDMMYNPLRSLKDWGLNIEDYIDKEELAKGLVDSDGWGIMNGYDNNYDSVRLGDNNFYIMRIN